MRIIYALCYFFFYVLIYVGPDYAGERLGAHFWWRSSYDSFSFSLQTLQVVYLY